MPHIQPHGGGCCGMRHVHGFQTYHENDRNASLRSLDDHIRTLANEPGQGNRLIEVVLAGGQVNQPMLDALSERGFRLVSRFVNSNSDNNCWVFHHVPHPLPLDNLPDGLVWNGDAGPAPRPGVVPAAPPAPPEPRFELRIGQPVRHRGNGHYGTYYRHEQLRDNAPNVRTIAGELQHWPRTSIDPSVMSTYHNHVRGARSEAGWPTYDAARRAAPRAMRVDKRSVYASGVIRWAENVHE